MIYTFAAAFLVAETTTENRCWRQFTKLCLLFVWDHFSWLNFSCRALFCLPSGSVEGLSRLFGVDDFGSTVKQGRKRNGVGVAFMVLENHVIRLSIWVMRVEGQFSTRMLWKCSWSFPRDYFHQLSPWLFVTSFDYTFIIHLNKLNCWAEIKAIKAISRLNQRWKVVESRLFLAASGLPLMWCKLEIN